jgi:hypothetical protein
MKKTIFASGILAGTLLLVGCGGGGGDSDDDDSGRSTSSPTPSLSIAPTAIREGSGKTTVSVQVSLTNRTDRPVSVAYETRDGTALSGEDYEMASGTLTIPKGARRGTIDVTILGDTVNEPDEYFEIALSKASGARLASSDAVAAISVNNDDQPPQFTFETRQQSVSETVGKVTVTAQLSDISGKPVTANLTVSGTALENDDYRVDTPASITFAPGEREASTEVEVLVDSIPEGGETITFEIDSIENALVDARNSINQHTIIILGDITLNDTGLDTFSDNASANLSSEPQSHPGQDAAFGRDSRALSDSDGHAGFSFTKLDEDGNPLPSNTPTWSCTRDNVTGLVWENKQPQFDLSGDMAPADLQNFRAANFRYAWRVDDETSNGGSAGQEQRRDQRLDLNNPVSANCAFAAGDRPYPLYCNTKTYLNEMNRLGTCGFQDWRMPSIEELRSIANYDVSDASARPDSRFQNGVEASARYWSSNPSADNNAAAWCFDYDNGEVKLCQKTPDQYRGFMAVRSPE